MGDVGGKRDSGAWDTWGTHRSHVGRVEWDRVELGEFERDDLWFDLYIILHVPMRARTGPCGAWHRGRHRGAGMRGGAPHLVQVGTLAQLWGEGRQVVVAYVQEPQGPTVLHLHPASAISTHPHASTHPHLLIVPCCPSPSDLLPPRPSQASCRNSD